MLCNQSYLMKNFRLKTVLLLLPFAIFVQGQNADSATTNSSFYILPSGYYQPETNWAFGLSGVYYFKSKDLSRISSVAGSAHYTLNNQFIFNATPKIYFPKSKWYLYSSVNISGYPDSFYGIGNIPTAVKIPYTSRYINLMLQPQYEVAPHLFVGGIVSFRNERIKQDSIFEQNKADIFTLYGDAGWNPYYQTNIGFVVMFDKRNSLFYAQKGLFAKLTAEFSSKNLLSTYSIIKTTLDVRYFLPLFQTHTLAMQLYGQSAIGKDIPFQLLSTLGGADMMRGFRRGMYRDNSMMVFQTEYRLPIYKRLKGVIFASTGEVFGDYYEPAKLKSAFGLGLRYRINDAGVHLRFDVAKNNFSDPLQFYLTASEAF